MINFLKKLFFVKGIPLETSPHQYAMFDRVYYCGEKYLVIGTHQWYGDSIQTLTIMSKDGVFTSNVRSDTLFLKPIIKLRALI